MDLLATEVQDLELNVTNLMKEISTGREDLQKQQEQRAKEKAKKATDTTKPNPPEQPWITKGKGAGKGGGGANVKGNGKVTPDEGVDDDMAEARVQETKVGTEDGGYGKP